MSLDIERVLLELFATDGGNHFDDSPEPLFEPPMLAVADAADPWWQRLKTVIGPAHWTPAEALALAADEPLAPPARSVICYCLPVAETARRANASADRLPARQWAYTRTFGEHLNSRLRNALAARLREAGHAACVPQELPANRIERREGTSWSSCWSERHAAFIAGMGTFGLSGGLITRRGIAHRLGSVVTSLALPATPRPYGDEAFAWCLHLAGRSCGLCVRRCPASSIGQTIATRDVDACYRYAHAAFGNGRGEEMFGWQGVYGCGLCQTAVPCERRNPMA